MKNVGILLPIFSLPNKYGIGDFGPSAYNFIDILNKNNLNCWEILPLNPIDADNSPYSPISSTAIEPLFISIDKLIEIGLLSDSYSIVNDGKINYENVRNIKSKYLKMAYANFKENHFLYKEFIKYKENRNIEYAKFMALKATNNYRHWKYFINDYDALEYDYQAFLQFIAEYQWNELKKYAEKNDIKIIGDLPIYVNYDSSDVYFNKKCFMLNNDDLDFVSGASPDYFNTAGQKWFHPLYDFTHQKQDNYQYLIKKYIYNTKLFDVIRIDHFRAFSTFYKIPINKSPKEGMWIEGPSYDFLDNLFSVVNKNKFIVEDLGDNLDEVIKLRDYYNLPGMKIFQYTFDFCYKKDTCLNSSNLVVYPGNHDNNTIIGWYNGLDALQKIALDEFLINYSGNINERVIHYLMNQPAKYLIFMVQDILGLSSDYRINIPGDIKNQWQYRMIDFKEFEEKIKILRK